MNRARAFGLSICAYKGTSDVAAMAAVAVAIAGETIKRTRSYTKRAYAPSQACLHVRVQTKARVHLASVSLQPSSVLSTTVTSTTSSCRTNNGAASFQIVRRFAAAAAAARKMFEQLALRCGIMNAQTESTTTHTKKHVHTTDKPTNALQRMRTRDTNWFLCHFEVKRARTHVVHPHDDIPWPPHSLKHSGGIFATEKASPSS